MNENKKAKTFASAQQTVLLLFAYCMPFGYAKQGCRSASTLLTVVAVLQNANFLCCLLIK